MYHACVCKERRLTASSVLPLLLLSRAVATLPHQASPRGRPGTQHRHLLHPQAMHRPPGRRTPQRTRGGWSLAQTRSAHSTTTSAS